MILESLCESTRPHGLFLVFSLGLSQGLKPGLSTSVQDLLTVLVHLQLDNLDIGGVDADRDSGTIGLFTLDPLNVNNIFLSVHLRHFACLLAFVVAPSNDDLVVLSDWHAADAVLLSQVFGQR